MKTPSAPTEPVAPSPPLDPALKELAERVRASSEPAIRALVPLSSEERRSLADKLLGPDEEVGREGAKAASPASAAAPVQGAAQVQSAPPALRPVPPVETRKPRSRRWWPLALAAAFGLLSAAIVGYRGLSPAPERVAYDLRAEGDAVVRGDPPAPSGAPLRLRPSTRLRVVLSPRTPVTDVAFRMLVVRDGKARIVRPPYENDGRGTLTIDKPAWNALGDQENGPAELVWVVGKALPDDAEVERIALDPGFDSSTLWVLRRAAVFEDWGGAVLFSGCQAMLRGPQCELDPGAKLVLWAPLEATDGHVLADGTRAAAEVVAVDGGTRWTLSVPAGTRQLRLSSPLLKEPFQLALAPRSDVPAIAAATRRLDENKLPEAEEILDAAGDTTGPARVAALRLRARIALRRRQTERAESLFREAISRAAEEGRLSDEIESRHVLAYQAMGRGDHAAAEKELLATVPLEDACRPCQVDGAYYRGLLAQERGRYTKALEELTTVRQTAARLGLADLESKVLQPLADLLSLWGRDEEALALLQHAYALSSDDPCDRGRVLTNRAWVEYRIAGTRESHEKAAARAEEALNVIGDTACGSLLATAQMNAGLAQAAAGRGQDARSTLDQVRKTAAGDARLAPWAAKLELELHLAGDPALALATATRLEGELGQDPPPELAFEAALGRAAALDALSRPEEASLAYEEASRREIAWGAEAPLGEGRMSFFQRQRSAFRAWVDFALRRAEQASTPEAQQAAGMEVARVTRQSLGRFFATLLKQSANPADVGAPVPAPAPGDVHLYYHPIRSGWAAVAVSAQRSATVARLPGLPRADPAALSEALLGPFEGALAGARKLVVFADRALRDVAFEGLRWQGGALGEHMAVAYGTAGRSRAAAAADGCAAFALLVFDPSSNLAWAQRTGRRIAERLGPGNTTVLAGPNATQEKVLKVLGDPCTRLFQYDGHAVFGEKRDGIEAALALADGPLSVSQIRDEKTLAHVPDVVVLSGCETGREEGQGIAHAFLERGSRQVLATTAKVDDALSAQLMDALYAAAPAAGAEWDLAVALRAAVRSLRGGGASAEPWAPFRVLVP